MQMRNSPGCTKRSTLLMRNLLSPAEQCRLPSSTSTSNPGRHRPQRGKTGHTSPKPTPHRIPKKVVPPLPRPEHGRLRLFACAFRAMMTSRPTAPSFRSRSARQQDRRGGGLARRRGKECRLRALRAGKRSCAATGPCRALLALRAESQRAVSGKGESFVSDCIASH